MWIFVVVVLACVDCGPVSEPQPTSHAQHKMINAEAVLSLGFVIDSFTAVITKFVDRKTRLVQRGFRGRATSCLSQENPTAVTGKATAAEDYRGH